MEKSKFITFEGGEGCGKSTQLSLLHEALEKAGIPAIKTREPGGSPGAETIRNLLVSGDKDAWDPLAETLLFYAARLDHVERVIKPALAAGKHVLCDRFADSTFVYQGIGKNLTIPRIRELHQFALGDFMPDLTFILDIDPVIGLERAAKRRGNETRFESMDLGFHQKVRKGFLELAKKEPERCIIINANRNIDLIHNEIRTVIEAHFL